VNWGSIHNPLPPNIHSYTHTYTHSHTHTLTHSHTHIKPQKLSNPLSKPKPSRCLAANVPLANATVPLAAPVTVAPTTKLPEFGGLDCKVS
jgi:hypothetical protein